MNAPVHRIAFLWPFARPWRGRIALAMLGLTFVSASALLYPWLLKLMADRAGGATEGPEPLVLAGVLLAVFILSAAVGYAQQAELQSLGYRLRNVLRVEFFSLLLRRPLEFFGKERAGELSARAMEDFSRLQPLFASLLAPMYQNGLVMAGCLYFLARIHPPAAAVVALLLVLPLPLVAGMSRRMRAYAAESTAEHAEANALLAETVVGIREVKAFGREGWRTALYARLQESAFRSERRAATLHVIVNQGVSFLMSLLLLGIFAAGTAATAMSGVSPGDVIAFYFYTYTLVMAAVAIGRVTLTYHGVAGAFERSYRLMQGRPPAPHVSVGTLPGRIRGAVRLSDVHFGYEPGTPVLRGVSFEMRPGTTLLLAGESGSGKSTLVNIIAGLLAPSSGTVRIDGRPLAEFPPELLRGSIGYVGQDPILFRGTIRENILWSGCTPDDGRMGEVLTVTCLGEFIASLPGGLETIVGERGDTLSGGERARIAIARALIHRPAILILDEANAMLGKDIERRLWPALLRERKGRTTLILSHHHEYLPRGFRRITLRDGVVGAWKK
jgi:ABC-type multidrug transport system fused ATPase/permease subunit